MSINKITYLSQLVQNRLFVFTNFVFTHLFFSDILELKLFLKELEVDKVYVVIFELHMSDFKDEDSPVLTLSEPILITKNSNPKLLSKFILNQINKADNTFGLDFDLIKNMNINKGCPFVLLKYNAINLF